MHASTLVSFPIAGLKRMPATVGVHSRQHMHVQLLTLLLNASSPIQVC